MMRLVLVLSLLAAPAFAQTIPMPFAEDREARKVSVVVNKGRTSMRGLSRELREARRMMHAKRVVPDAHLRALAQRGDGLAAQKYVNLLVGRGEAASNPSDVAYFAAIAVGTGRVWTLSDMIAAMHRLEPGKEPRDRIRKYIQVLYPHAWAGNSAALKAVVDFNGEGKLFGALSNATRDRILSEARETGDGRTELRMALAIMEQGDLTDTQRQEATRLLESAQQTAHPGIRAAALNMARQLKPEGAAID